MPAWAIAVIIALSSVQHPSNQCERTSPIATEWYYETDGRPVARGYGCEIITIEPEAPYFNVENPRFIAQ